MLSMAPSVRSVARPPGSNLTMYVAMERLIGGQWVHGAFTGMLYDSRTLPYFKYSAAHITERREIT